MFILKNQFFYYIKKKNSCFTIKIILTTVWMMILQHIYILMRSAPSPRGAFIYGQASARSSCGSACERGQTTVWRLWLGAVKSIHVSWPTSFRKRMLKGIGESEIARFRTTTTMSPSGVTKPVHSIGASRTEAERLSTAMRWLPAGRKALKCASA